MVTSSVRGHWHRNGSGGKVASALREAFHWAFLSQCFYVVANLANALIKRKLYVGIYSTMTFEEATREAARAAHRAVTNATERVRLGRPIDEDDLTGILVGQLDAALDGEIAGLRWDCSILRHRGGSAGEEREIGADLLLHIRMDTPTQTFSKGALVQAKKVGPDRNMTTRERDRLIGQCQRMLAITAAAFVFDYGNGHTRCGAASRIAGATSHELYRLCGWTSYRFFLEFFRSPIGDSRITSALVDDLPTAWGLEIRAQGSLDEEGGSPFPFRGIR